MREKIWSNAAPLLWFDVRLSLVIPHSCSRRPGRARTCRFTRVFKKHMRTLTLYIVTSSICASLITLLCGSKSIREWTVCLLLLQCQAAVPNCLHHTPCWLKHLIIIISALPILQICLDLIKLSDHQLALLNKDSVEARACSLKQLSGTARLRPYDMKLQLSIWSALGLLTGLWVKSCLDKLQAPWIRLKTH